MDPSLWLANKLPTGRAAPAIAVWQAHLAQNTSGDKRALGHLELWKIYKTLASEKPVFSVLFRRLADYHLDQALLWRQHWPEPLSARASLQITEGDLPKALESVEQYVESESEWCRRVKVNDRERLLFCRYLFIGGGLLGQLGRFADAVDWYTRAQEELNNLPENVRCNVANLQDEIFQGAVGCLLLDFRYAEAHKLIRETLQGALFQTYESKTRRELRAFDEVLGELAKTTQAFEFSKPAAELRAKLTEEIQRCDSSEAARRIRRDILTAVTSTEVNRAIQELARAILMILKREREELERTLATLVAEESPIEQPPQPDLSKIHEPEVRKRADEFGQVTRVMIEQQHETWDALHSFELLAARFSLQVNRASASAVRDAADSSYEVPAKYGLKWRWWGVRRFVVQIVAVSYLLEQIAHKALEEKGLSLLERLNFERLHLTFDDVMKGAIVIIVFMVGQFVEKWIDQRTLASYKSTLLQIVGDRFTVLWTSHNFLLKIYATNEQTEGRLQSKQGTAFSPDI